MFKRFALTMMMVLFLTPLSMAEYPSGVTILDQSGISQLSNAKLIDTYENTLVALDASRAFHATSGFSPKEYKDFRDLLKFRILLIVEIHKRNLDIPQF